MKKLFALLMALCLMLTAFAAMAETFDPDSQNASQKIYGNVNVHDPELINDPYENDLFSFKLVWDIPQITGHSGIIYNWDSENFEFVNSGKIGTVWNNFTAPKVSVINFGTSPVSVDASFSSAIGVEGIATNGSYTLRGFDAEEAFNSQNPGATLEESDSRFDTDYTTFALTNLPSELQSVSSVLLGTITVTVSAFTK